ncbi:hypothetical protein BD626DRAFT_508752 [Schizophyllum amplum]|uniref:Zn(2)-C6 fungal-type domain-containing protein n=1 Tax=Schizophyllum amplum TaxID=97359 RepID=A0A550C375_9AGAR|nr:hypothetical protein BD626DRAFT_508752 [Auriculariopsis ampla]
MFSPVYPSEPSGPADILLHREDSLLHHESQLHREAGGAGSQLDFEAAVAAMMEQPEPAHQRTVPPGWYPLAQPQDPLHQHHGQQSAGAQAQASTAMRSGTMQGLEAAELAEEPPTGGALVEALMASPSLQATRQRTAQACEKCRERKAKCSGGRPVCERCAKRGLICHYAQTGNRRHLPQLQVKLPAQPRSSSELLTPAKGRPKMQRKPPQPRQQLGRTYSHSQPCSPVSETTVFSWMPSAAESAENGGSMRNHYALLQQREAWQAIEHSYLAGTLNGISTTGLHHAMGGPSHYQEDYAGAFTITDYPPSQDIFETEQHGFSFQPEHWSGLDGSDGGWTEFSEPPSATQSEFSPASDLEPHSRPWSTSQTRAPMAALVPPSAGFQFDHPHLLQLESHSDVLAHEGVQMPPDWLAMDHPSEQQQRQDGQEAQNKVPLMYPTPSMPMDLSDLMKGTVLGLEGAVEDDLFGHDTPSEGGFFGAVV